MRFAIITTVVALSVTTLAQSTAPQPYTRFIAGTVAQDIATTPKGGWLYIVGSTTDPAYPVTPDAFDRTCGADGRCDEFQGRFGLERRSDIVLTVVDAAGEIRYSTFLGGGGADSNPRIALTRDGTLWLAANTTGGGFEHVTGGCSGSLVVTRFEWTLQRVDQQVCLNSPSLSDIALDADGSLWVLGTSGTQEPTVNAFQPTPAGQLDFFLARFSSTQASPLYSTYIGGSGLDTAAALALTPDGDIAIVGTTNSANFPLVRAVRTTPPTSVAQGDVAVLVLDRAGRLLEFSTYWGGRFSDSSPSVAVAANGDIYVAGSTQSADLPVTPGAADTTCDAGNPNSCFDAFVTRFTALGEVRASTFFGGSQLDGARMVAVRPDGKIVLLGSTQSPDFPLVGGQPFQHWRANVNFEHSYLATFDAQLTQVTRAVFVGDEQMLPSVPRFALFNGFAYVAGQVTTFTGAPGFGNYLSAQLVP